MKVAALLLISSLSFGIQKETVRECIQKAEKHFQVTAQALKHEAGLDSWQYPFRLSDEKIYDAHQALNAAFIEAWLAIEKCKISHANN